MNSNYNRSDSYLGALRATDQVEPPSLGITRPSEHQGTQTGNTAIIKQNNTQLVLLTQIADSLKEIHKELQLINRRLTATPSTTEVIPEALITKLQNLTLGPPERRKEPQGKFLVLKNPYKLLKEEQERLKKKDGQ